MSQILGFIGDQIDPANFVEGFCPAHALNLEALEVDYIERKPFAEDPANGYIHFIPYIVIRDPKTGKVFKYTRSTKGGEDRLHAMCSVGLGGHVDYEQDDEEELTYLVILKTAVRELAEELNLDVYEDDFKLIGYIYDNSNEVGKVHLGVLLELELLDTEPDSLLTGGEEDVVEGREWIEIQNAGEYNFENWSKIALSHIV
jgi:predicted NUDIX family phosphoesterase